MKRLTQFLLVMMILYAPFSGFGSECKVMAASDMNTSASYNTQSNMIEIAYQVPEDSVITIGTRFMNVDTTSAARWSTVLEEPIYVYENTEGVLSRPATAPYDYYVKSYVQIKIQITDPAGREYEKFYTAQYGKGMIDNMIPSFRGKSVDLYLDYRHHAIVDNASVSGTYTLSNDKVLERYSTVYYPNRYVAVGKGTVTVTYSDEWFTCTQEVTVNYDSLGHLYERYIKENSWYTKYTLLDVDGDGTKDLILYSDKKYEVSQGKKGTLGGICVVHIEKGKTVDAKMAADPTLKIAYNKTKHTITPQFYSSNIIYYNKAYFKNGKLLIKYAGLHEKYNTSGTDLRNVSWRKLTSSNIKKYIRGMK